MAPAASLVQAVPSGTVKNSEKPSRFYRPELDAIRFLLFLGVFFFHSVNASGAGTLSSAPIIGPLLNTIYNACGFALSFFFFLSSYLITCLLQLEKQKTGTLNLRSFYVRRLLRLWPLYLAYLALIFSLRSIQPDFAMAPGALFAMILFTGNWYLNVHGFALAAANHLTLVNHLWSISVEEQFYLLFPTLARRLTRIRLQQVCFALCLAALATTWVLVARGDSVTNIWSNSMVEALFFASGVLFALRSPLEARAQSLAKTALGVGGGLLFWVLAQTGGITNPFHLHALHPWTAALGYAAADAGCICILWGVLHVPTTLLPRALVYLGRVAYGLYVFHMLVIWAVRRYFSPHIHIAGAAVAVELLLTIAIATFSYEFFEKPFLRLKHRFELVHSRAA